MTEPSRELQETLRAPLPPSVAALGAEQQAVLQRALRGALDEQHRALVQAMDDGLGFVPRLLRGAVKKALFG